MRSAQGRYVTPNKKLSSEIQKSSVGLDEIDVLAFKAFNTYKLDTKLESNHSQDVARCDRNLPYFQQQQNLEKLRNVVTTYVWQNLEVGYMQVRKLTNITKTSRQTI